MELREDYTFEDFKKDPLVARTIREEAPRPRRENFWETFGKKDAEFLLEMTLEATRKALVAYHKFLPADAFDHFCNCFPTSFRTKNKAQIEKRWKQLLRSANGLREDGPAVDLNVITPEGFFNFIDRWRDNAIKNRTHTKNIVLLFLNRDRLVDPYDQIPFSRLNGYWAAYFLDSNVLGTDRTVQKNYVEFRIGRDHALEMRYRSINRRFWKTGSTSDFVPYPGKGLPSAELTPPQQRAKSPPLQLHLPH